MPKVDSTVTVTRAGKGRFVFEFSKLPGRKFGPYGFADAICDLTISALLSPVIARNTVIDASASGMVTTRCDPAYRDSRGA